MLNLSLVLYRKSCRSDRFRKEERTKALQLGCSRGVRRRLPPEVQVIGEYASCVILDGEARLEVSEDEVVVENEEKVRSHQVLPLSGSAGEHLNRHGG